MKVRAFRTLENAIRRMGFVNVAGVDEVGRGCLAGPVVAAAVVLNPTQVRSPRLRLEDGHGARARAALRPHHPDRGGVGRRGGGAGRDRSHQHPPGVAARDAARRAGARPGPGLRPRRRLPHPRPADGAARRRARRLTVHRHRRRLDRRQGHARPADASSCTRTRPAVRLRSSQRLRDRRTICTRLPSSATPEVHPTTRSVLPSCLIKLKRARSPNFQLPGWSNPLGPRPRRHAEEGGEASPSGTPRRRYR